MNNEATISVGIMTAPSLFLRYRECIKTWVQDFDYIYMFGGYKSKDELISLGNIGENYKSAFLKQQLGLKFMYRNNPNLDWYSIVGCDTILFKERLVAELSKLNASQDLFVGTYYNDYSIENINFTSIHGGPGFYLSNSLMKKVFPIIDEFNIEWYNKSQSGNLNGIDYSQSDLAISFMIKKYFNINFTPMSLLFGDVKNFDEIVLKNDCTISNEDKPIALHYVKASRMDDYYQKYK
jgi:hypothetical protein